MKINEKEIRSGVNAETTIGNISEYAIKVTKCQRKVTVDGNESTINSAWINGKIIVDVNGAKVEHKFSYVDTIRHKRNGDENKSFASIMTALGYDVAFNSVTKELTYTENGRKLEPAIDSSIVWVGLNGEVLNTVKIKGSTTPSRVSIKSQLGVSHVLNKDGEALNDYDELPVSFISTTNVPEEDSAKFVLEGVLQDVQNEYDNNGNETGRYLIKLVVVDYFGAEIIPLIMEKEWTAKGDDDEEFTVTKEDFYGSDDAFAQLGDSIKISGEIVGRVIGSTAKAETSKKTFGGGAKNLNKGGYVKVERLVRGGNSIDADGWNVEDIQIGLDEREIKLGQELNRQLALRKEKASNAPAEAPKSASPFAKPANATTATAKPNPFSNTAKNPFMKA